MFFTNKVVLITGASSGIGEALAYEFAKQNAVLLLCARNQKELERVKLNCKAEAEIFVCDVTDFDAIDLMLVEIYKKYAAIDVLVNNAGISQRSFVWETDFHVDKKLMNLNYFAPVYLTKKVLPSMMERKDGRIIVISSVSGKFGFWQRSAYAASKHALHGFFETIQIELREFNIQTLLVCAGGVQTNISKNAIGKDGLPHGKLDDLQRKGITPASLASRVVLASAQGTKEILMGKEVILYRIKKWWPWMFFKITETLKGR